MTHFGVAKDATKIHVQALQSLAGEAADKHDSKNSDASGWIVHKASTVESKKATFVGQIPSDFFRSCSQFLQPLQDLKLHLLQIGFRQLQNEFGYFQNEFRFFRLNSAIYKTLSAICKN